MSVLIPWLSSAVASCALAAGARQCRPAAAPDRTLAVVVGSDFAPYLDLIAVFDRAVFVRFVR
jgi:hypothetical protein